MKKNINLVLIICFSFLLVFTGCQSTTNTRSLRNTGPTGKVVIYTSIYEDVIEVLREDLKKQFPNIQVEFVYGGTGTLQARVSSELAANRLGCDLLLVAEPSYSIELKERGILHQYRSPQASSLAFEYDRDGYWYPVRVSNMVLAYNPRLNARNTVPNSFYDFAHSSSVKGAISMSNPLTSGTSMATVMALHDKYGIDYFSALGRQNITIDSGSVALGKLETGEYKVIMVLEEAVLKLQQEERSRLEVIYPTDGTVVIPSTIMIINDRYSANKNTRAAEVITDWFLSPEGQNSIVSGWMHSVRDNFPRLPYGAIPTHEILNNAMPVNWDSFNIQRAIIQYALEDAIFSYR